MSIPGVMQQMTLETNWANQFANEAKLNFYNLPVGEWMSILWTSAGFGGWCSWMGLALVKVTMPAEFVDNVCGPIVRTFNSTDKCGALDRIQIVLSDKQLQITKILISSFIRIGLDMQKL